MTVRLLLWLSDQKERAALRENILEDSHIGGQPGLVSRWFAGAGSVSRGSLEVSGWSGRLPVRQKAFDKLLGLELLQGH